MFNATLARIKAARKIIISTHRHCDGDGLGAEVAMFHALKNLGKDVRIVNVDKPGGKYSFLTNGEVHVELEIYSDNHANNSNLQSDLALIFDTNDARLVEPLFSQLKKNSAAVVFVDHHPPLRIGPAPTVDSWIDTSYASTGEMAYRLILGLGAEISKEISRALYTSVVFDTQLFRYIKSDSRSHEMAADLLRFEKAPEEVHRALFATYTAEKMQFLASAISQTIYSCNDRLAFIAVDGDEVLRAGFDPDETGDAIDLIMNIRTIDVAVLVRKDPNGKHKISMRSKGRITVLPLAEQLGGGGHPFAAGATIEMDFNRLKQTLLDELSAAICAPESIRK